MQPPPLVVKANLLRSCQPRAGGWDELRGRGELGCVLAGEGVGWAESRHAAPLFPAARSIGEHAGAVENKKVPPARCVHVGELCAPGSWALTSDPGSSRLSPGVARPLFTQDATRGPRSCRARVLAQPPFPASRLLPLRRQPRGRILHRGTPAPPPPGPQPRSRQPGRAGGVLGAAGPRGRREEAGPAALPRPGPVDCHWSAPSAPSPPAPPQPFRRIRGRKRGGSSPRLPSTFFFLSGGGEDGRVRPICKLLGCPSLPRKVSSRAGPPPPSAPAI